MASSAFKSTSKRGNLNSSVPLSNRDSDSSRKTAPPPVRKRSLSVSAISRTKQSLDISTDFSNKRENPLFWASVSSSTENGINEISTHVKSTGEESQQEKIFVGRATKKESGQTAAMDQRGRLVTRSSGVNNGIGRSISRVRRRSVSRGHYGSYESEKEHKVATVTSSRNSDSKQVIYKVKNDNMVRDSGDIRRCSRNLKTINSQGDATECSEDDSACSFQISNWEDGISTCSLSEEEKNIKAVCEQTKPFQVDQFGADSSTSGIFETVRSEVRRAISDIQNDLETPFQLDQFGADSSASGMYETVRSEVRRAISDIQNDLESVIRRNNVNAIATSSVSDFSQNVVGTGAVEFVMYARKLEESQERARKLRNDLALEEHRGKELNRILQEILSDPKTSNTQKSRMGRKRSTERKKISRRLTEEAMAYFDECVSISTLDSSDFSAPEDLPCSLAGPKNLVAGCVLVPRGISGNNLALDAQVNYANNKQDELRGQDQPTVGCEDSKLTANSSSYVPATDVDLKATSRGNSQTHQFSFAQKPKENFKSHGIQSYIKHFEREGINGNIVIADGKRSEYDTGGHNLHDNVQRLFERVVSRNRIESGGLHLCSGDFTVSFSPFGFVA